MRAHMTVVSADHPFEACTCAHFGHPPTLQSSARTSVTCRLFRDPRALRSAVGLCEAQVRVIDSSVLHRHDGGQVILARIPGGSRALSGQQGTAALDV